MDGWLGLESIMDILQIKKQALFKKIQRGKFTKIQQIKTTGKGSRGGKIWQIHITDPAIPKVAQDAWFDHQVSTLPEKVCNLPVTRFTTDLALSKKESPRAIEDLKRWQRTGIEARMVFIRLIEQAVGSGIGVGNAISIICKQASEGSLPPPVQGLIKTANQRAGNGRTLSASGVMKWWASWKKSGGNPMALAPLDVEKFSDKDLRHFVRDYKPGQAMTVTIPTNIPLWLPFFLDVYRKPGKPSISDSRRQLRNVLPPGISLPSIGQIGRICKRIPIVLLEKGRATGAEYKSLLGYADRDASEYDPFTLCQIDGHSYKAYVAHPTTGAHFHPEVCGVICLTTKVLGGWSWGLAESWRTVADAVRHTCTISEEKPWGGTPAIVEPDRGSGNMAKVNSDEVIGLFARNGITFLPPERGGNPQGHGAIERSNQSIWIRAAKRLQTYTGKDMDRGTRKRVYIKLEKDLKAVKNTGMLGMQSKTSEILLTPEEFTQHLRGAAIEYNNTPHSALPKITAPEPGDPEGKAIRRHMTPFEALAERIAQGYQPIAMPEGMLPYLFMPHEPIKVRREKFTLRGNTYHAYELCNYHLRDDLVVAYDIHNAEQVYVLDADERFICTAKWNGNRIHAVPVPVVQQAIIDREQRRTKNLENKLELIRGEANPAIQVAPTHIELSPEVIEGEKQRALEAEHKAVIADDTRRYKEITSQLDIYYMLRKKYEEGIATEYERGWKEAYAIFQDTGRKLPPLKDDPYCLNDPDEDLLQEEL